MKNFQERLKDIKYFYQVILKIEEYTGGKRKLKECTGKLNWPKRGVYFFFEENELRSTSGEGMRVVRVGTHALNTGSKTTLWDRLKTHRGNFNDLHAGGGNHRGSIFRKNVGNAIILRDFPNNAQFHSWGKGNSAERRIRNLENPIEVEVSRYIGNMPFLWIEINDEPGPDSLRGYIERNSIALLSNFNFCHELIDPPSKEWLGYHTKNPQICHSGLWNSNYVDYDYDSQFLKKFLGIENVN